MRALAQNVDMSAAYKSIHTGAAVTAEQVYKASLLLHLLSDLHERFFGGDIADNWDNIGGELCGFF